MNVPFLAWFFKCLISFYGTFLAGPSNRKFHAHDRKPKKNQKQKVKEDECTAASLACDIWKFPYISDSDGTPGREQDKAKPGFKFFSFHKNLLK